MSKHLLAIVASLSLAATTAFAAEYDEDVHYQTLMEQQPVQTGNKIEVVELFWYGCPHCYNLEPYVEAWRKNMPDNAELVRLPAVLRESWAFHARVYHTFEALGMVDALHAPFFEAIHKERRRLNTLEALTEWAAGHGVEADKLAAAFNSFAVETKLRQARVLSERYEASAVPTVIVDGRYRSTSTMAGGHEALLQLVDFLVAKAAAERQ